LNIIDKLKINKTGDISTNGILEIDTGNNLKIS
jgi:hypothetical protein